MGTELTQREVDVLEFIKSFTAEHGWSPTVREVATALGWSSTGSAYTVLVNLAAKGAISWVPRTARTIRVLV